MPDSLLTQHSMKRSEIQIGMAVCLESFSFSAATSNYRYGIVKSEPQLSGDKRSKKQDSTYVVDVEWHRSDGGTFIRTHPVFRLTKLANQEKPNSGTGAAA